MSLKEIAEDANVDLSQFSCIKVAHKSIDLFSR
jgi:hypothetical protein